MKALSIFGQALLMLFVVVAYVVAGVIYIPLVIAYYVVAGAFTFVVFTVCAMLVMVYKFSAWLSRLAR